MAEPLKDSFDEQLVERIAAAAERADPRVDGDRFDRTGFVGAVMAELPTLELKDRVSLMADELFTHLGGRYLDALPVVIEIAAEFRGESMDAWPLCSVVERHGLAAPDESFRAMERLTRAFSCEFAIRPFLREHLDATIEACHRWARSPIAAVRRLASEGTRPYLPWGLGVPALVADPTIGIDIISPLRHDPDEVVRRSVANHLNDVARRDPDRVAALAAEWSTDSTVDPAMIRHALRSLVKKGHVGALETLGFTTDAAIDVATFTVTPNEVRLGESIELSATLRSTADRAQRLVIDFVVHHVNANGATSPKVFKWATLDLAPRSEASLVKSRLVATASTRRYHAGIHRVELQVAGRAVAEASFDLLESS